MRAPISDKHLKETCKPGTEDCCRYLLCDADGFFCGKKHEELKWQIDLRANSGLMRATKINCEGPYESN